jgi:hypothetical protein
MKLKGWHKTVLIYLVLIIIFTVIYNTSGIIPLCLFIILILSFGLYRLWSNRVSFITSLRYIESMIWGKPLDKDMWNKGEFKNTKVKIVWRKKKNETAKP